MSVFTKFFELLGFYNYNKDGPGVPKEAPPKHPAVVFFEIYARKFWQLVTINLMFTAFNLPAVILAFLVSLFYLPGFVEGQGEIDLSIRFAFIVFFTALPLITIGPAQAGLTFLFRNYAREEHAFIWSDFKEQALKNFKQALAVSLLDWVIVTVIGFDIIAYSDIAAKSSSLFFSVAVGVLIGAFGIYVIMHLYMYPLMINYRLSFSQLFKNAFYFAGLKLLPNLFILAVDIVCVLITAAAFVAHPLVGIALYCALTVSTITLINNFYVNRVLKEFTDRASGADEQKG